MPLTSESEPETVEEAFEGVGAAVRDQIEEAVISQPIKALLGAFVVGVLIGKLIL